MTHSNTHLSLSQLIAIGSSEFRRSDTVHTETISDHLHIINEANNAITRLCEGVRVLGCLLLDNAGRTNDHIATAQAAVLIEDVGELITTLTSVTEIKLRDINNIK